MLLAVNMIGCKSKKDIAKATNSSEMELPFSGKNYKTDESNFRSVASGTSTDLNTAKEIAMMNARSEISYSIKTVTKNVADIYINERNGEHGEKLDRISRQVSKAVITNIIVADHKVFQNSKEGTYTYWVVVEVSKDAVINNVNNLAAAEKIDFDKYQYEKVLNEEMKQIDKQNELPER